MVTASISLIYGCNVVFLVVRSGYLSSDLMSSPPTPIRIANLMDLKVVLSALKQPVRGWLNRTEEMERLKIKAIPS